MNINLNAGGLIGAVLGAVVGGFVWASHWPPAGTNLSSATLERVGRADAQFFVLAIILGAVGGTALWSAIFHRKAKRGKRA
jgi:hypothetical protein